MKHRFPGYAWYIESHIILFAVTSSVFFVPRLTGFLASFFGGRWLWFFSQLSFHSRVLARVLISIRYIFFSSDIVMDKILQYELNCRYYLS